MKKSPQTPSLASTCDSSRSYPSSGTSWASLLHTPPNDGENIWGDNLCRASPFLFDVIETTDSSLPIVSPIPVVDRFNISPLIGMIEKSGVKEDGVLPLNAEAHVFRVGGRGFEEDDTLFNFAAPDFKSDEHHGAFTRLKPRKSRHRVLVRETRQSTKQIDTDTDAAMVGVDASHSTSDSNGSNGEFAFESEPTPRVFSPVAHGEFDTVDLTSPSTVLENRQFLSPARTSPSSSSVTPAGRSGNATKFQNCSSPVPLSPAAFFPTAKKRNPARVVSDFPNVVGNDRNAGYSKTEKDFEKVSTGGKGLAPQNLRGDPFRRAKVKTELCLHFKRGRICPFGDKCNYAHGQEELKYTTLMDMERAGLADAKSYRCLPCFSWISTGAW